jgi:hypothetical protein
MAALTPWTVTVNGVTPVVQLTVTNPAVLIDCVQPVGAVEVSEKVTVPVNPLIGLTVTCEVPAVFAVVVIAGAERVKSWIVTSMPTVRVIEPLTP